MRGKGPVHSDSGPEDGELMAAMGTAIIKMPKLPSPPYIPRPQRLPERKRMTLIGTLPCAAGAVLLADRQETIGDYPKWDVDKIKH